MGKSVLNNSENLSKLKEEFNLAFEQQIENAKINELMESLYNYPLGSLRNLFESVSSTIYDTKGGKKLISAYINVIRENKSLRTAYSIYEAIKKPKYVTDVKLYLSESFNMGNGISNSEIVKGKKELVSIIAEAIKESGLKYDDVCNVLNEDKDVNDTIMYMLKTKKTVKNLNERTNRIDKISKWVSERVPCETIDEGISNKELVENIGDLFENNGLEHWENDTIKDLTLSILSGDDGSKIFETYKNDVINVLTEQIEDEKTSVEEKSRLVSMKEGLLQKEFTKDTLAEDLLKLSKLKNVLI